MKSTPCGWISFLMGVGIPKAVKEHAGGMRRSVVSVDVNAP